MTIDLLNDVTKLKITDFEFEDLNNMDTTTGYDFTAIKLRVTIDITNLGGADICDNNNITKHFFIKMIRKDRIKESIFCYWNLLYDEMFKRYEESEFTNIINKVRITEMESEQYKHSVLLQIKENKWGILENGSTIHLIKFTKYIDDRLSEEYTFAKEWKKYIEQENEDVLFIGIIN